MKKDENHIQEQIKKAKEGNQIAYSYLLNTYWSFVYGFLLKRTNNESDSEDITIQTFSKAFDKLKTFDESYEFKTWLITISKNIHIDLIRKRKKSLIKEASPGTEEAINNILDDSPTIEDKIITEQNLTVLLQHIKKLKPHYQKVINLRYFNELSYQEIANEIEEPLGNIKVKLLRAKKLLAAIIVAKK